MLNSGGKGYWGQNVLVLVWRRGEGQVVGEGGRARPWSALMTHHSSCIPLPPNPFVYCKPQSPIHLFNTPPNHTCLLDIGQGQPGHGQL
jgi:hypothetical protein